MRSLIFASAATVVLLTTAVTGPLSAQSPQTNGKDATKVYAYKKAAPPASAPSAYEPMTTAPQSRPDLIPNSVPYGTPSTTAAAAQPAGDGEHGGTITEWAQASQRSQACLPRSSSLAR
jgi:hypothetical protein